MPRLGLHPAGGPALRGGNGAGHLLDLYLPAGGQAPYPTVHLDSRRRLATGSKEKVPQARRLVCSGFALASVNYRLSGEANFPAQVHDVKAAIRFLRANAAALGLDAERFGVFGSSAGGRLAAPLATSAGCQRARRPGDGPPESVERGPGGRGLVWPNGLRRDGQAAPSAGLSGAARGTGRPQSAESELLGCTLGDGSCPR